MNRFERLTAVAGAVGGASVARQYLAAGLLEEIDLSIVPVLLGESASSRASRSTAYSSSRSASWRRRRWPHVKYRVGHG